MSSSFFAGLRSKVRDFHTPWLLSDPLFQRVRTPSAQKTMHHECEVLPSDPEYDFVKSYFFQYAPLIYSIKRIFCIHNPPQTEQFEASLLMMDGQAKNPIFSPKWPEKDPTGCRAKVMARWRESAAAFSPVAVMRAGFRNEFLSHVFVFPYWHGSNQQKVQSICDTGFTYFGKHNYLQGDGTGSTDIGFFGSGIYFTNSARYAADIYSSGHLLLAWVSMRSPYPVIEEEEDSGRPLDREKLERGPAFENYDAHYIPVIAVNTSDPMCKTYVPCRKDQIPMWDEAVVFHSSQTLPRFYVELMVTLPKTLVSPVTMLTQLLENLQQLSNKPEVADNPQLLSLFQQKKQLLFVIGDSSTLSSADQQFFDLIRKLQTGAAKIDDHVTQQFLALASFPASDTKPSLTPPSASLDSPFDIPPMLEQCVPYKEILEAVGIKDKALAPPGSTLLKVLSWRWIHGLDEETWKLPCFDFDNESFILLLENEQVVCGNCESVQVWDPFSEQCLRSFKRSIPSLPQDTKSGSRRNKVISLGKGLLLFQMNSRDLVIWDFGSEEIVQYLRLPLQFSYLYDFVLLKNGYIAAVFAEQGEEGEVCLWKLFSEKAQKTFKVSFSCNEGTRLFSLGEEYLVIITPDDSGLFSKNLTIWSPNEEKCLFDETAVDRLGFCLSEEEVVCWGGPFGFSVFNLSKDLSGEQRSKTKKLIGHEGKVLCCCRLQNGYIISGSEDKTLKIWDTQSGQCVKTFESSSTPVIEVWELKNGLIVSKGRYDLGVWNPQSGKLVQTLVLEDLEDFEDIVDLGEGKVIVNFNSYPPSKAIIFDLLKRLSIFTFSSEKVHCYGQLKNGSVLCHFEGESILRSIDPTNGRTLQTLGISITSSPTDPYQLPDGRKLLIHNHSIFLEEKKGIFQCIVSDMPLVPLLFLKDGCVLVMKDGNFGVVDPRTGVIRNTFPHYGGRVPHYAGLFPHTIDYDKKEDAYRHYRKANYGKLISSPGGKIVALLEDQIDIENQMDIWDRKCNQIMKSLPLKGNPSPFFLSEKVRFLAKSFGENFQVFLEMPKVLETNLYGLKAIELQNSWIVGVSEDRFLKVWDAKGECLRVLKGHEAKVSVAIELHGNRLISGSEDGILKIWDLQSGQCLHTWKGHESIIYSICELKDGFIASGDQNGSLKIWSLQGTCLHTFSHSCPISSVFFLKDGRFVTFSEDGIYSIRNLMDGKCEQEVKTHLKGYFNLAQCQDGNLFIFRKENPYYSDEYTYEYTIFDLKTGKALSHLFTPKSFRISEEKIVSFFDGKAFLWNPASGKCIQQLQSSSEEVRDCILLQDSSLLISFEDGTLQKWEQDKESCVKTWCREGITALVQLRNGRIVTGSNSTLKVWSPDMQECLSTWDGYNGGSLLQLEDGSLVSAFDGGGWNVKTGERTPPSVDIEWVKYKMKIQTSTCLCGPSLDQSLCKVLDLSRESDLQWALRNELQQIQVGIELREGFLVYEDSRLRILDPKTSILLGTFENTGLVHEVFLLEDGSLATTFFCEEKIRILDPCTGKCLHVLEPEESTPPSVPPFIITRLRMLNDAIPGGISSSALKIWNSLSETLKTSFQDFHNLTQLEDDSIALSVSDGNIAIWNKEKSECLEILGGKFLQKGLLLLQDGSILNWLKGNPTIRIWNSTTGKMIQILRGHRDSVTCAIQLREGPIVSGSRDSTLKVWDVKTGNCLRTLQGHQGPITSVLQLSENTLLSASKSEFGTLKIWNFITGECLKTIPTTDEPVRSLLQLRDGRILSRHKYPSDGSFIKLWDLKRGVPVRKLPLAGKIVFDEIRFQDQVLGKDKIHLDLWHPFLMPLPFPDLFSSLSPFLNRLSEQIKEEIFKNELPLGTQYRCQLTKKILQNPVRLKCGHIFEAAAIEKQECPLCKEPIQGPVCIDRLLQKALVAAIEKYSVPRMSVIPVLEVPDEVSAFHNRACLLVEQKEFTKALGQYSEALRFTNRSSAYLPIVQILKDQFPDRAPSSLLYLAELQAKEEDLFEIRKTLLSFSELPKYSHNPYLLELLGECALLANDLGEAQTFYKLAVEQYESKGQKEDIIRGYEKILVANLSDFSYYEKLLQLYEDKEKKIALLYMGIFELRESNPEAAQALVKQAEELDPGNPLFFLTYEGVAKL